jgi:Txe/YoeB family toxin of toxin-antitoxin system
MRRSWRPPGSKVTLNSFLAILAKNPYQSPPPFETLVGDLAGAYSRRINIQHRLVYQDLDELRVVKVQRLWTHYQRAGKRRPSIRRAPWPRDAAIGRR